MPAHELPVHKLRHANHQQYRRHGAAAARGKGQVITVGLGEQIATRRQPVTLAYTYWTLVRRGHLLHLDISQLAKGLHLEFSYKDCGIPHVDVRDYIAGAGQPQIAQLQPTIQLPRLRSGTTAGCSQRAARPSCGRSNPKRRGTWVRKW